MGAGNVGAVMGDQATKSYRDLDVWRVAMDLAESCYNATKAFPKEEAYGMIAQIRQAATSVPANIAEGYGPETTGAFVQFLRIAQGSIKELETHLILAERVGNLDASISRGLLDQCDRIGRMLRNLIRSLQSKAASEA